MRKVCLLDTTRISLSDVSALIHLPGRCSRLLVGLHQVLHMPSAPQLDGVAGDELAGALLREAAAAGNAELVTALLKAKVNPMEADVHANTALHRAAEAEQLEICKKLTKAAQWLRQTYNFMQMRPCDLAKSNALLRILLPSNERQCNSDRDFEDDETANITRFMKAAKTGNMYMLKNALSTLDGSTASEINARSRGGCTALSIAAEFGHTEVLELLLTEGTKLLEADEMGSFVNNADQYGQTALMLAAWSGHAECIRLLLDARWRADIYLKDTSQNTALTHCAMRGQTEIVEQLLEEGADVHPTRQGLNDGYIAGLEPLHAATFYGHEECLRILLAREHVDVNQKVIDASERQRPAIFFAVKSEQTVGTLHRLLEQADVNVDAEERVVQGRRWEVTPCLADHCCVFQLTVTVHVHHHR